MSVSIATRAREYAAALDRLEAARAYLKTPFPKDERVTVTWQHGRAMPGYPEIAQAVSDQVSRLMPELIQNALAEFDHQCARAHGVLMEAVQMGAKGRMRAGDVEDQERGYV